MKKIFFILISAFFVFADASLASAQVSIDEISSTPCNELIYTPEIVFTTSYGNLTYDFSMTQNELTDLSKQFGIVERGLFASGLALVKVNWEIEVETTSRVSSEKDICVIPIKVEVFIGYEDPVIHMSKDLVPGTCEYSVVMRHEQTHQQINKTALEYFIPKFKLAVEAMSKDIHPVNIDNLSDISKVNEAFTAEYVRQVSPLVEYFKQQIFAEHAKLDNRDNYNLEGRVCP